MTRCYVEVEVEAGDVTSAVADVLHAIKETSGLSVYAVNAREQEG